MKSLNFHWSKSMEHLKQVLIKSENTVTFVNFLKHSSFLMRKKFFSEQLHIAKFSTNKNLYSTFASNNFFKNKINGLVLWYEEVTGMDEVRFMQNRVIDAQDKFVQAQDKRIGATASLNNIQNKLKDVRSELDTATKGEERYLRLITHEHTLLKEEKNSVLNFQISEKEERDCFTFLSSAVQESHEKERAQAERTKYWSVIGSIIGTVIGVVGSSINNEFKMKELRKLIKMSAENRLDNSSVHHKELIAAANEIKVAAKHHLSNNTIDEIVAHNLNNSHENAMLIEALQQYRQEMRFVMCISVLIPVICLFIQKVT